MLGSEFKKIRVNAGYNQMEFSEILGITQERVNTYEWGFAPIPSKIEEAINKMVDKKSQGFLTNKYFSRLLFLQNMLTGNEVVDSLYLEAEWLKEYDGKQVYVKATSEVLNRFARKVGKINKVNGVSKEYFLLNDRFNHFLCKEEWLR